MEKDFFDISRYLIYHDILIYPDIFGIIGINLARFYTKRLN